MAAPLDVPVGYHIAMGAPQPLGVVRLLHTAGAEEPLGLHLAPSSSLAGGPFLLSFFCPWLTTIGKG